ncbi:MAG: hypothetical protein U0P45_13850 [Acidimicrobiales bacterium]
MSTRRRRGASLDAWTLASSEGVVVAAMSAAALLVLVAFLALAARIGPDFWVPALLVLVLSAISIPAIRITSGRPVDRRLYRLLLVAFALKLLCVFPRYAMNELAYGGNSDAGGYNEGGAVLRQHVLQGEWSLKGAYIDNFPDETKFVAYVTGVLFLVTGASQMAAYFFFAWLGWVGLMCCFRAFRLAYPNAPPYKAAWLIFLLPSTLYWPSSLGKDALMLFGLGLIVLGATRLMLGKRPLLGLAWIVLGAAPILQVRPHLLLVALVGGAVSMVARSSQPGGMSPAAVLGRILLLAALVPALMLGLSRMDQVFGATGDAGFSVTGAMRHTSQATSIGGSAFAARPVQSPADVPVAAVNVLFRPFIFEASSLPSFVSSLESTLLLVLTLVALRWVWRAVPEMRANPLAAFCGGFTLAFVFAFSNIGNAGILARQRIQLFPILMILVAAAAEAHRLNNEAEAADLSRADQTRSLVPDAPRLVTVP